MNYRYFFKNETKWKMFLEAAAALAVPKQTLLIDHELGPLSLEVTLGIFPHCCKWTLLINQTWSIL